MTEGSSGVEVAWVFVQWRNISSATLSLNLSNDVLNVRIMAGLVELGHKGSLTQVYHNFWDNNVNDRQHKVKPRHLMHVSAREGPYALCSVSQACPRRCPLVGLTEHTERLTPSEGGT